ncbi:MAG: SIS domain-containing protein [Candidatus Hodarchaeota archaeon]
MPLDKEIVTPTFHSAYKLLLRSAKRCVNTLTTEPTSLATFCQILSDIKENKNAKVHIIGRGCSGLVGKIIGESLKDINYSVSYLGDNLALPINKDDVLIAVTGSGWTKYTNFAIEEGIRKKARILIFTGSIASKAAKLANAIIHVPMGFDPKDNIHFFSTRKAPLSPLGSIFELTTFIIGIGIVNGIHTGSCTYGFDQASNIILREADKCLNALQQESNLHEYMKRLKDYFTHTKNKVFLTGSGINQFIAQISAIRLQNLMINVVPMENWRFRQEGDLLISISGSGSSISTINYMKNAKESNMNTIGISSLPQSELAKLSDIFLHIQGNSKSVNSNTLKRSKAKMYLPVFEYLTALTLESTVAQMAVNFGISSDMSNIDHANI